LSHAQWARVETWLSGKTSDPGRTAVDKHLFVDAVLWVLRSGVR
jgi:transposase